MPLVASFMFAGAASLAGGSNCFATGVTAASCITAALWMPTGGHSLGAILVTRTGSNGGVVIIASSTGVVTGELFALFAHSIIQ